MAKSGRRVLRAVVDAPGLQHIIERQSVRDSLRTDPQRPRGDDVDIAVAEASGSAAIFDRGRASGILQDLRRASLAAMLEPRERGDLGDTLTDRQLGARHATDFPQPRRRLGKGRQLRGGN